MGEESETGKGIVPDDKDTELILPGDMVRRGLELAIRIEQKSNMQKFSSQDEGEYLVRCQVAIMEWYRDGDNSLKLRDTDKPNLASPIYLVLSVDKGGIRFSCPSQDLDLVGMENNEDRFRYLTVFDNLSPFFVPFSSLGLFYKLISPVTPSDKGTLSHLSKEDLKNIHIGLEPGRGQPGYTGAVLKKVNPFFKLDRDCVETVLIYVSMLADPNLNKNLVSKNPPLKLRMVVIDQNGERELISSRALYHAILEGRHPDAAQLLYVSVEELYRNIPGNPTQETNWRQWQNNYEGRVLKASGTVEAISIHPRGRKIFVIVTIANEEGLGETKLRRVALLVEDAHQVKLGEKEGSFLVDDTKWINLGEKYTFKGTVSKFSLFEEDLVGTDFRDVIIINMRLRDIN
ncbi:MAG: hypothetical protein P8046_01410 [Anaerolineales bacterium]